MYSRWLALCSVCPLSGFVVSCYPISDALFYHLCGKRFLFTHVNTQTFSPGDHILLEDGDRWGDTTNQVSFLHPGGSGASIPTNDGSIYLSDYVGDQGTAHPLVEGNGDTATLLLENQEWWEVSNLEITNRPAGCADPPSSSCQAPRRGVWIHAFNNSNTNMTYHHIYLSHLDVHDVVRETGITKAARQTGGIVYQIDYGSSGPTISTTWDDIHVSDNIVHDVWRNGIFFYSDYKGEVSAG